MKTTPTPNRRQACAALLGATALGAESLTSVAVAGAASAGRVPFRHVAWATRSTIYEVNIRQFTPEGTLKAFEAHLPRLAKLGVHILWLMPLQPIGQLKRKGSLGSYYAICDYTAVNPEFGTLEDLQRVVQRAHALGLKVILDWVANHTAWDHPWVTQHPDWYQQDAKGEIGPFSHVWTPGQPAEVWEDVVGLDYGQRGLWDAMTDAMLYWQREVGFDGFRCDVAGLVPVPFWNHVRAALDRVKPVFMLAESDRPELQAQAFDMGYDWALYDRFKAIAQGKADAVSLRDWWAQRQAKYPPDAWGMNFVGNHDTNSWDGTDLEFYGTEAACKAMTVLSFTLPGMPMILGGQEGRLDKRLAFFEKDPIAWKGYPLAAHYLALTNLKRRHPALANGAADGKASGTLSFLPLDTEAVAAFERRRGPHGLRVAVNLSAQAQTVHPAGVGITLAPWAWRIDAG